MANASDGRFQFGKNWSRFLTQWYSSERLEISQRHLLRRLRISDLSGMSFLDIGCGSGLHSLAAYMSGAEKIVSFDFDINSVETTNKLWSAVGRPPNWSIMQGSVLEREFMESLGFFDIVYAWGVLHHTGNMWEALRNAARPLGDEGILYVALYAYEMYMNPSPEFWIDIKRRYNAGSVDERKALEYWFAWERMLKNEVSKGKNPFELMDDYKKSRGMEFWTDVRDWLGGFPMEFAKTRDVAQFVDRELGMTMLDVVTGEGNTEYLLCHSRATTYWNEFAHEDYILTGPFEHVEGHCFGADVPTSAPCGGNDDDPCRAPALVLEDGVVAGFPHARHDAIVSFGEGRHSHWKDKVLFSASDNSDPNVNGRSYTLRISQHGEKEQ